MGFYRDNGKENGNYYLGFRDSAACYGGFLKIPEQPRDDRTALMGSRLGALEEYIGRMEHKMEATIMGLFRDNGK